MFKIKYFQFTSLYLNEDQVDVLKEFLSHNIKYD